MAEYTLTVEMSLDKFVDHEDFKDCVLGGLIKYHEKHPEANVVVKHMDFRHTQQTLAHRDIFGNWYLPMCPRRVEVKRIKILRGR